MNRLLTIAVLLSAAATAMAAEPYVWIEGEAPAKVTIGQQDAGDKHFRFQGRTVLVLDKETADRLEGKALDVEKTSDGVRFVLK